MEILEITKMDSERRLIKAKVFMLFTIIRTTMEYIECEGKYYSKIGKEVSTEEVQQRLMEKAMLKYKLEK